MMWVALSGIAVLALVVGLVEALTYTATPADVLADLADAPDLAWLAFEAQARVDHLVWRWAGGCGDTEALSFPEWSVR